MTHERAWETSRTGGEYILAHLFYSDNILTINSDQMNDNLYGGINSFIILYMSLHFLFGNLYKDIKTVNVSHDRVWKARRGASEFQATTNKVEAF